MKKGLNILLASGLLISLCACGKSNNATDVTVSPSSIVSPSISVSEESPLNTDEQSPEKLITSAMEVYGWFAMVPLKLDYENKIQQDGMDWFRVKDEEFNTHEKLDKFLKTIFSSEIVAELWNYNAYKEFDGYLYSLDGGRGANIYIEDVKYDTSEISENKIIYTATVTYSKDSGEEENPKVFEFVREKIDGNWVFTSFPYFL